MVDWVGYDWGGGVVVFGAEEDGDTAFVGAGARDECVVAMRVGCLYVCIVCCILMGDGTFLAF